MKDYFSSILFIICMALAWIGFSLLLRKPVVYLSMTIIYLPLIIQEIITMVKKAKRKSKENMHE